MLRRLRPAQAAVKNGVHLFLPSGEVVAGEIMGGNGRFVVVGLAASVKESVPMGQPLGLQLHEDAEDQRMSVTCNGQGVADGIQTVHLALTSRASMDMAQGTTQARLFNERAAFRLPVSRDEIEAVTICSVNPARRAARPGGARATVRGARFQASPMDVSFDGLGLFVNGESAAGLKRAVDVHVELESSMGTLIVDGKICQRRPFGRGSGALLGVAAGVSRISPWREEDEELLRRFVGELQRRTLERLREA